MPRLLDLFCGAGGAAMGYHRAGFEVVGVDINPQPNYPFEFHRADAIEYARDHARYFHAAHGSMPCQRFSDMSNCRPGLAGDYPDLVAATREVLDEAYIPYALENVPGAPLREDHVLCGQMFGLELYRHRIFEINGGALLSTPGHPKHTIPASKAGHWRPGTIMSVAGHVSPIAKAREVMGIDWMTRDELAESIPPAYAEFIGRELMAHLERVAA